MLPAHSLEAMAKVVGVVVEESALLDKVDEHHTVEHEGGVPFTVGQVVDALNKAQEVLMLLFEAVVEFFGDLLDIEGGAYAAGDVHDRQVGLLVEGENDRFQLLDEPFATLTELVLFWTGTIRPARFALDPEPILSAAVVWAEDDDMLPHLFGEGPLDLLAGGAVGEVIAGLGKILVGDHAALVGDGL